MQGPRPPRLVACIEITGYVVLGVLLGLGCIVYIGMGCSCSWASTVRAASALCGMVRWVLAVELTGLVMSSGSGCTASSFRPRRHLLAGAGMHRWWARASGSKTSRAGW